MTSLPKLSYHRLSYEGEFDKEEEKRAFRNIRKWPRFRRFAFRKRANIRIPVLRRFCRKKRSRFFSQVKVSWSKALKRLKNGQAHMNDLFGGNYLFMQANPTPRCGQRPFMGHHIHIHGLPSRHSLGKVA